jgi:AcrR family transcriptional regulator
MTEKPYHHGNLRNSLIEVGISLIHTEGIEHLSLRRVAALCGVSQAAPYAHFENKDALLDAMRAYATEKFTQALLEAKETVQDENDPRILIEMGKRYVQFFLKNPQYFNFIFSQMWMRIDLDITNDSPANFPPYMLLKTHALRIFRAQGIPDERIEDMVIAMWASVHGLTSIATMKNVHYSKNWGEKIEDIIQNI